MKQKIEQPVTLSAEKIQADIADLEKQRDEAMARVNALLGALSYANQLLTQLVPPDENGSDWVDATGAAE